MAKCKHAVVILVHRNCVSTSVMVAFIRSDGLKMQSAILVQFCEMLLIFELSNQSNYTHPFRAP